MNRQATRRGSSNERGPCRVPFAQLLDGLPGPLRARSLARLAALSLALSFALLAAALPQLCRADLVPVLSGGKNAANGPENSAAISAASSDLPRNAWADKLKPKRKSPALALNHPYQPIRKPDDQGQTAEIEMFVGESRVFPAPGVGRIAVGNGQILTAAALDNREVILFANAVGTSSVFLWNEDGRYQRVKVNIVPGDTSRFAREIASFLATIPNTRASIIGDKVVVDGDNLSDRDLAKIDELSKRYPQIVNFTDRLGWEPMVMLDVKVVEFPVNELRELGLKWTGAGGAALGAIWSPIRYGTQPGLQVNVPGGSSNPAPISNQDGTTNGVPLPSSPNILSAINLGLTAQLNALQQSGRASILAEPQLAARSGSRASFLAGGEVPYSVSNINGTTVLYKPYGVKLDILPRVDRKGLIRAVVESEVSKIDSSLSTTAGPGLLTRKTNTEFNMKSGDTLVLSGLVQLENSTNIDKVPFLGDIPVLGALFRSKRFQNNETELVVFVTPTVIDSQSPALVERVDRTYEKLEQNLGKPAPWLSHPLQPGHDPAMVNQAQAGMPGGAASGPGPAPSSTAGQTLAPVGPAQASLFGAPLATASPALPGSAVTANLARATSSALPRQRLRVTARYLALRVAPDINAQVLDYLQRDTLVDALTQPAGGYWLAVEVDGKRGWAARPWLVPED